MSYALYGNGFLHFPFPATHLHFSCQPLCLASPMPGEHFCGTTFQRVKLQTSTQCFSKWWIPISWCSKGGQKENSHFGAFELPFVFFFFFFFFFFKALLVLKGTYHYRRYSYLLRGAFLQMDV